MALDRLEDRQLLSGGAAFALGDVFVGVNRGVQWRRPDGSAVETLSSPTQFNTGMAFAQDQSLYVTGFSNNQVNRYGPTGDFLGTFGSGFNASPESIVFDAAGNVYVGQADGGHRVLKFDPAGNLVDSYPVQIESRGSDWIDLAADQRTLYYTSEGKTIKRYDLATKTQLADFATGLPGDEAFQPRILADGGVLVADDHWILRLGPDGSVLKTYGYDPGNQWFALALDPDGASFWCTDQGNGTVSRFSIATGEVLTTFVTDPLGATGLAVKGEIRAATAAALGVATLDATATTQVGATATYTVQVANQGVGIATRVVVRDTLPAGATFVSAISSTGAPPAVQGGVVTFNLGDLAAGAGATVTVVVRADAEGTMVNTVVATTDSPNATPANSIAIQTTIVSPQGPAQPPTVIAVRRQGIHCQPTRLVLAFNQEMNAGPAQSVGNYQVEGPLRGPGRRNPTIPIRTASYDPRSRTVTLTLRRRLDLHWVYQLTVFAGSGGLTGTSGVALAGNGNQPGTNFVTRLKGYGPIPTARVIRQR